MSLIRCVRLAPAAVLVAALISPFLVGSVTAELEESNSSGFISTHQIRLAASPKQAYRALTRDVQYWWDGAHTYSGHPKNLRLQAKAGSCFCELLAGGGSVEHMRVIFAQPGKRLRLGGGLGPLQGLAVTGVMDFALTPLGDETVLSYSYRVSGASFSGLEALAEPVDKVQLGQLQRLQRYLQLYSQQGRKPLGRSVK